MNKEQKDHLQHYKSEKREKQLGSIEYRADADGTIRLYDSVTTEEISLTDMALEERKDFFEDLYDVLEAHMPRGYKIIREDDTTKCVPEDYIEGDQTAIATIQYVPDGKNAIKIKWVGSKIDHGAKLMLAYILKQFPNTQWITGELEATNMSVYHEATRKGLNHFDALRQTPAYKYRAACGFNDVDTKSGMIGHRGRPILVTTPLPKK